MSSSTSLFIPKASQSREKAPSLTPKETSLPNIQLKLEKSSTPQLLSEDSIFPEKPERTSIGSRGPPTSIKEAPRAKSRPEDSSSLKRSSASAAGRDEPKRLKIDDPKEKETEISFQEKKVADLEQRVKSSRAKLMILESEYDEAKEMLRKLKSGVSNGVSRDPSTKSPTQTPSGAGPSKMKADLFIKSSKAINVLGSKRALTDEQEYNPRPSSTPPTQTLSTPRGGKPHAAVLSSRTTTGEIDNRMALLSFEDDDLRAEIGVAEAQQGISGRHSRYINDNFAKKARSLAFNPARDDSLCSTGLDGSVRFYAVRNNGSTVAELTSITKSKLHHEKWVEDIAWSPDGARLAMVYPYVGDESQVVLLRTNTIPSIEIKELDLRPHNGNLSSVCYINDTCDSRTFVTGGADHTVVLWREMEEFEMETQTLFKMHTSNVSTVTSSKGGHAVYSGGYDKRVTLWSLEAQQTVYRKEFPGKVNCVQQHPTDPAVVMVSQILHKDNIVIIDERVRDFNVMKMSWEQSENQSLTTYTVPRWSPSGFLVSCGSCTGSLFIWDVRFNSKLPDCLNKPVHQFPVHDNKRVFIAEWHKTFPLIVTNSSDHHLGIHTFNKDCRR